MKNLDQFSLNLDQFLTLKPPNLGPVKTLQHTYIYIYIYAGELVSVPQKALGELGTVPMESPLQK